MEAGAVSYRPAAPFGRILQALGDERLVARVRAGDDRAFEAIYHRHHRGLLSFCRHMLGSREEAEDALQHTFASAYRSLRESSTEVHLKAWLYAIARNRCLSMLRVRRETAPLDDAPATDGLAAQVQRRAELRELLGDLERLPEDQRAALVLSELGAHSHEEIAVILDVRTEKVKALVFQARESLFSSRQARDTSCEEIREQLATLRGGALRRTPIRRHLDGCESCREFRAEVRRQRAAMAAILPVAPSLTLKATVLGAASLGGAGLATGTGAGIATIAGGAAGGGVAAVAQGVAAKALVAAAVVTSLTPAGLAKRDLPPRVQHDSARGRTLVPAQPAPAPAPAAPAALANPKLEVGSPPADSVVPAPAPAAGTPAHQGERLGHRERAPGRPHGAAAAPVVPAPEIAVRTRFKKSHVGGRGVAGPKRSHGARAAASDPQQADQSAPAAQTQSQNHGQRRARGHGE